MSCSCGCSQSFDPQRLTRDGTSQGERAGAGPLSLPVLADERRPEHAMVFAAAYARYVRYVDLSGTLDGDWSEFFTSDVSARLAAAAIEDVGQYRVAVTELLRDLRNPDLTPSDAEIVSTLTAVFDSIGTLALGIDVLLTTLPTDHALRATVANLIRSQLSPMLRRLLGYYSVGQTLQLVGVGAAPSDGMVILGQTFVSFATLLNGPGLAAEEWPAGVDVDDWAAYVGTLPADSAAAFGSGATKTEQINHLATHHLFKAAAESFLAAYARIVDAARTAVQAGFKERDHAPHYALFLAFLGLLEHARTEVNRLPAQHLDFYYRDVLRLRERPAEPSQAHVLVELAKHVDSHLVGAGTRLRAGKDLDGNDVHFAVDRDLVANRAAVADVKSLYRHPSDGPLAGDRGRVFARLAVDTEGEGHPFVDENYKDGRLLSIAMPKAEVGLAIASSVLWMAEGTRKVTVTFTATPATMFRRPDATRRKTGPRGSAGATARVRLLCRLSAEKGWIDRPIEAFDVVNNTFSFDFELDGSTPAVTPYDPAVHGYSFGTSLPVLLVLLVHSEEPYDYPWLSKVALQSVNVKVDVQGIKTLTLSNDHGPVDGSKPFLAYGSAPVANSSLVIGSQEVFGKQPSQVAVHGTWMATPVPHETSPTVVVEYLSAGKWGHPSSAESASAVIERTLSDLPAADIDPASQSPGGAPYSTSSRSGFVRLRIDSSFGTEKYPISLATWVVSHPTPNAPTPPVLPMVASLTLDYVAEDEVVVDAGSEKAGRYFHLAPFGHAEQAGADVPLLPQFTSGSLPNEGELYVGVRDLRPPQNLALLFQVVDGTANPLVVKPTDHIRWSYLRDNQWVDLEKNQVDDGTRGLLASGVITLAVPAEATTDHTLLPAGLHWIRLAVPSRSDATCRLLAISAQALAATLLPGEPGLGALLGELGPNTISKLDRPESAVKAVSQPFAAFGGRPVETGPAFATRVSERLRHKDRAIAVWDYEHLVLEAFPSVYQARCLNHTQFEPTTTGGGTYRELAPGHVTVVTVPDLAGPETRDPLRPYTSLRVLEDIAAFLTDRMSCFARLHVCNPQFEEVRVGLRVRLREGIDETFHANLLRREITEFLSPWAFRGDARPRFNGKVQKSVLINFIDERPYVDFVTDVRLYHLLPGEVSVGADVDEVVGSRAVSVLVSSPMDQHDVQVIHQHRGAGATAECSCAMGVS